MRPMVHSNCPPYRTLFITRFTSREYTDHSALSFTLCLPLFRSSGGGEVGADGDSSWVSGSNIYTSSLPHNPLMPPMMGDDTHAHEWSPRSGHISNPFLEVYDEQQLMEQKKLLRRRLQASKERQSLRNSAIRAHEYTDDVTNNANAFEDSPRYKLPLPPGPPKYDDDDDAHDGHDVKSHSPYHPQQYSRRTSPHSSAYDYLQDNPTSASSRSLQMKTVRKTRVRNDDSLSAFTSAEALAAADLLSPPPPLSSQLTVPPSSEERRASPGIVDYERVSRMKSQQQQQQQQQEIESEHKTKGISRRSNRVKSGYGSTGSVVTSNVLKNSLDHPYFASVLKKDKTNITH